MAFFVYMPRLGAQISHGRVVAWLKSDGESVKAGEPIVTVAGDEGETDLLSAQAGILHHVVVRSGHTVPAWTALGFVGRAGEKLPAYPPLLHFMPRAEVTSPWPMGRIYKWATRAALWMTYVATYLAYQFTTPPVSWQDWLFIGVVTVILLAFASFCNQVARGAPNVFASLAVPIALAGVYAVFLGSPSCLETDGSRTQSCVEYANDGYRVSLNERLRAGGKVIAAFGVPALAGYLEVAVGRYFAARSSRETQSRPRVRLSSL